jgi:hypothetical protein
MSMFTLKYRSFVPAILVIVLLASFGFTPARQRPAAPTVSAQEEEMGIVCDASTILLLYIALHDYDYGKTVEMMAAEGMEMPTFYYGQFAPLFEALMAMTEGGESMEDETMMPDEEMMAAADAATEEMMMGEMMLGGVEGEPEECTTLRSDLEHFFLQHFIVEQMMMESQ